LSTDYKVEEIFNVSGFAEHAFYRVNGTAPKGPVSVVIDSPKMPDAFVRSNPIVPRNKDKQQLVDKDWNVGVKWNTSVVWKNPVDNQERNLAREFCFPRCATAQPNYLTSSHARKEMVRWLRAFDEPYNPYSDNSGEISCFPPFDIFPQR